MNLLLMTTSVTTERNEFHGVAWKILQDEKPSKVTILVDGTIDMDAVKSFNSIIPSDLYEIVKFVNSNDTLDPKVVSNFRSSSLHVILIKNPKVLEKLLDFLVNLFPKSTRPKCLAILFDSSVDPEKIIAQAWSKKFLDFSLLAAFEKKLFYYDWNPFSRNFNKTWLSQETKIFPQKLSNVHGQPIKFPIYHDPPYLDYFTTSLVGIYIPLFELLVRSMNFTMDPVKLRHDLILSEIINESLSLLKSDDIDVIAVPESLRLTRDRLVVEINDNCRRYIAIAPIIRFSTLSVPSKVFFYLLVVPTVTIWFVAMAKFFKLMSIPWGCSEILRLLFGVPVVNLVNIF